MISACRTAIGDFLGSLKAVQARDLAITVGKEAIRRSGVPADQIDEICMGQIFTALQGSLPSRQVSMRLGMSEQSGAVSVNQNCASGMRALEIAAHNIMLGKTETALIVAVESMAEKRPAFRKNGVVTMGNVSGMADGAAAAVIMSKQKAGELGIPPLMRLINTCTEGIAPEMMGLGPAVAIPKCLN